MTSTDMLLKLSAHFLILLDNPQKIIEAQEEEENSEKGTSRPIKQKSERCLFQPGSKRPVSEREHCEECHDRIENNSPPGLTKLQESPCRNYGKRKPAHLPAH